MIEYLEITKNHGWDTLQDRGFNHLSLRFIMATGFGVYDQTARFKKIAVDQDYSVMEVVMLSDMEPLIAYKR